MNRSVRLITATLLAGWIGTAAADQAAPNFTLVARDGRSVSLADLKGQVVMINFWATWCGPCRQEMPLLDEMYQRYNRLGFTLLGINVEDNPKGTEAYLAETPVSFPILFDPDHKVSKLYDVIAMPSTVLVDRNGSVRYVHAGYQPGDENTYLNHIRALIRE